METLKSVPINEIKGNTVFDDLIKTVATNLVGKIRLNDQNDGLFDYILNKNHVPPHFWISCCSILEDSSGIMFPMLCLDEFLDRLTSWGNFDKPEASILAAWLKTMNKLKYSDSTHNVISSKVDILTSTFKGLFELQSLRDARKNVLDGIQKKKATIEVLASELNCRGNWFRKLNQVMNEYDNISKETNNCELKIRRLQLWIPNLVAKLTLNVDLPNLGGLVEQMNYSHLLNLQTSLANWLMDIDPSNDKLLDHFLIIDGGSKSILFKHFLNEQKMKEPREEWENVSHFNSSLTKAKQKIVQLLQMQLSFEELLYVGEILRSHSQPADVEVNFIFEFFSDSMKKLISHESLNTVLTLYSLKEPLKTLVGKKDHSGVLSQYTFACTYNSDDHNFTRLETIASDLSNKEISSKWSFDECNNILEEVISILVPRKKKNRTIGDKLEKLNGILHLFDKLNKSVKVWEFFCSHREYISDTGKGYSAEFKEKIEDFLSQLSGDDYKLLCIFDDVAKWMSILVYNQKEALLTTLIENIFKAGAIVNHINSCKVSNVEAFSSILIVEENMDFFHQLFLKGLGGLDAVVGQYKSIAKFGLYIFEFNNNRYNMKLCYYDEGKNRSYELDSEDVLDLELRLGFIQKEDKLQEFDIDSYLKRLQFFRRSMSLMYDLYSLGHPQWKSKTILLPIGKQPSRKKWIEHKNTFQKNYIEITEEMVMNLEDTVLKWTQILDDVISKSKVLCLYNPSVAERLAGMIAEQSTHDIVLVVSLLFTDSEISFDEIN